MICALITFLVLVIFIVPFCVKMSEKQFDSRHSPAAIEFLALWAVPPCRRNFTQLNKFGHIVKE
ncbi:MAG: hypothetical protein IK079_00435, partial [Desulfovibrio sp.]|nr:hypothetical protein [Desulfovibrio sp.]